MRLEVLLGVAVFGALGAAVWLFAVALIGTPSPVPFSPSLVGGAGRARRNVFGARAGLVVAAGLVTLVVTRWPVAALATAALVWSWSALFGGGAAAAAAIDRLEALAGWTESLKDTIAGAIGLDEAIPATAAAASPSIHPHVAALVARLEAREPLPRALGDFADDLDDPSADLVVAALILNAQLRGRGLRSTLEALATSARDELDLRRRIEAGRRALRTGVRIIVGVTIGFVTALALLDSAYLDPYDTVTGQVVLAGVAGVFAAAFAWLRSLGAAAAPERVLTSNSPGGRVAGAPAAAAMRWRVTR